MDLASDSPKINVNGQCTETGNPRVAFISVEAKESSEELFKIRDEALNSAVGRSIRYAKSLRIQGFGLLNLTQPTLFGVMLFQK